MAKVPNLSGPGKTAAKEEESPVPSIQLVSVTALQPTNCSYATSLSSGVDIPLSESKTLIPNETVVLSTGIRLLVANWTDPEGQVTVGKMYPRSSMRKKGLTFLGTGIIDLDYEGEIKIIVQNTSGRAMRVNSGDFVAQLIFERVLRPNGIPVKDKERGTGGFGSTGT